MEIEKLDIKKTYSFPQIKEEYNDIIDKEENVAEHLDTLFYEKPSFKKPESAQTNKFFGNLMNMIFTIYKNLFTNKETLDFEFEKRQQQQQAQHLQVLANELEETVNEFISNRDEKQLTFILKKGYKITNKQCVKIMDYDFKRDEIKNAVEQHLTHEFTPYIIGMFKIFITDEGYYSEDLQHEIREISSLALKQWSSVDMFKIFNNDEALALEFLSAANNVKKNIVSIKFSWKTDFIKHLNAFIEHIENEYSDTIEAKLHEKMSKYNILFNDFDSIKKNITSDTMDNIKKFKESDLPQDSRDIINVIKKTYLDISKDKLNVEQQLELENLFNKRFPQIIEEYILISPRYKEKLISHNESPDQLLLDSLTEIQNKINVLFELQETGKHNKMKVSNRYLKKI